MDKPLEMPTLRDALRKAFIAGNESPLEMLEGEVSRLINTLFTDAPPKKIIKKTGKKVIKKR